MIYKKYLYKAYLLQHIFTDIEVMIDQDTSSYHGVCKFHSYEILLPCSCGEIRRCALSNTRINQSSAPVYSVRNLNAFPCG